MSTLNVFVLIILFAVLLGASYTDLKTRIISNKLSLTAIGIIVIIRIFHHPLGWLPYFWGIVPALLMLIAAFASRGKGFGGGDIKLMLFVGLVLGGTGAMITLILSYVLMLLYYLVVSMALNKKETLLPMAPFILLGVLANITGPFWFVPMVTQIWG